MKRILSILLISSFLGCAASQQQVRPEEPVAPVAPERAVTPLPSSTIVVVVGSLAFLTEVVRHYILYILNECEHPDECEHPGPETLDRYAQVLVRTETLVAQGETLVRSWAHTETVPEGWDDWVAGVRSQCDALLNIIDEANLSVPQPLMIMLLHIPNALSEAAHGPQQ